LAEKAFIAGSSSAGHEVTKVEVWVFAKSGDTAAQQLSLLLDYTDLSDDFVNFALKTDVFIGSVGHYGKQK